jgi:putative transposase
MKNTARKKKLRVPTTQLTLAHMIRADLHEFVISAGTAALAAVLEHERTRLVGPRYAHLPGRHAHRAGSAPGELVLGGRRVQIRRPRARTVDGREVELPTWAAFGAEDPLHTRAVEQMLVGVSTRNYARSLEAAPEDLAVRGTSRSAVSRRFVAATDKQMAEWLGRDLGAIDLVVLMIDGVYIEEHVLLVALGIDVDGTKHVLGVREGATENAASCTALITDMRERGLRTDRAVLAVIDGSKALAKAIRDVYGARALIQRCQAHKSRNVLDQLPEDARPSVRQALRDAYGSADVGRAKKLAHESRAAAPRRAPRRRGLTRRGPRRDGHREAPRPAVEAGAAALDDERDREPDGRRPPPHTAREAVVAWWQDDPALDGNRRRRRRPSLPSRHRHARRHDRAGPRAQGSRECAGDVA